MYYLDGAGNWGFGTHSIATAVQEAGYEGEFANFLWTTSLNPLVDQLNLPAARMRAAQLSRSIRDYCRAHPDATIDVIAFSAGTGVAVWAVEQLDEQCPIDDLVLLGSSHSSDYDITPALRNISGRVYVYHSTRDAILGLVPVVGTIDGRRGVPTAGTIELAVPPGCEDRIVNVPWEDRFLALGWRGDHTGVTGRDFVREMIAPALIANRRSVATDTSDDAHGTRLGVASVPAAVRPPENDNPTSRSAQRRPR